MKETAFVVCLAMLLFVTTLILAAEQKVDLITPPPPSPNCVPATLCPGSGFVIFSNQNGLGHNFEITLALVKVLPNTAYDIYLFIDGYRTTPGAGLVGTVTTNTHGNATFQYAESLGSGMHTLGIDVVLTDKFAAQYITHPWQTPMNFE